MKYESCWQIEWIFKPLLWTNRMNLLAAYILWYHWLQYMFFSMHWQIKHDHHQVQLKSLMDQFKYQPLSLSLSLEGRTRWWLNSPKDNDSLVLVHRPPAASHLPVLASTTGSKVCRLQSRGREVWSRFTQFKLIQGSRQVSPFVDDDRKAEAIGERQPTRR